MTYTLDPSWSASATFEQRRRSTPSSVSTDPIAFDLGILLGNLLFACYTGHMSRARQPARMAHGPPAAIWTGFEDEFWALWPQRVDHSITKSNGETWLARIARHSIGFAGCEVIRRVVGFAKVSDIETLPPALHAEGAACTLDVARGWLTIPPPGWTRQLFAGVGRHDDSRRLARR